jgi:hypothetical protein
VKLASPSLHAALSVRRPISHWGIQVAGSALKWGNLDGCDRRENSEGTRPKKEQSVLPDTLVRL